MTDDVRIALQSIIDGMEQRPLEIVGIARAAAARIAELTAENERLVEYGLGKDFDGRIHDLEAALAERDRDAERLSWLDRDDVEMVCTTRMGKPIVLFRLSATGQFFAEGENIRVAIDAALAAKDGK